MKTLIKTDAKWRRKLTWSLFYQVSLKYMDNFYVHTISSISSEYLAMGHI